MTSRIRYADVQVGTPIPEQTFVLKRVDLLRYCGGCSDFTATHWNERVAKAVGLPDVIAHGTLIIAEAVRIVSDWVGDPGAVVEYSVSRFAHPVVVPDDDVGAQLRVSGRVEQKLDAECVVARLSVHCGGREVVAGARAVVRLA
ncbi:MaoC/PaaZ C-terminal domain-containing protein [Caldimonas brevitalea]|uniref:Dehydratase n=1 Tax=Caldimonas brevitalea TaxID=413882 RepID=A0A0G3BQ20_9BURK|nr:MaoC/PaaZ C-terminal domain-containing protein [Caldimonas brevitalea]AKJ30083.1 dehydratase [Caldimonas brevitalea]